MNLFRLSLSWQMLLATVLGIFSGLFFGDLCSIFQPWTSAYVMLLKVTTIPYLVCAIIHGIGLLSGSQIKEILKKGALFIGLAWAINIAMIYLTAWLFPRVQGEMHSRFLTHQPAPLNFAELLIPENIFYALSNNIIPAVVIFSVLIGIAFMHIKEKQGAMNLFQTAVQSLTAITAWISRITPIGTFIIIAYQVGTTQLTTIQQVSTYIILYVLALCWVIFWIFPRLTSTLTTISFFSWLQYLLPILLIAYTTNVVIVALPYIIALVQRETQQLAPRDEKAQTQIQGTVSIIFNLPLTSLFIVLFIFFISNLYRIPLTFLGQIQLFLTTFLTSLGAVGLGSWINTLSFLLDTLNLPMDAIDLFLAATPFTAGFQSMVAVMEITTLSLLITLACRKWITWHWRNIARSCAFTAIPLSLFFVGMKWYSPFPPLKSTSKSIYELDIASLAPATIYTTAHPTAENRQETLQRVLSTKILRVGYSPNAAPFCFYNHYGKLVGYDIAFAYQLAEDLNCAIEFVPLEYGKLGEELDAGQYDIGMAGISISTKRLQNTLFTSPYLEAKVVFVGRDAERKKFGNLSHILENKRLKIAALSGTTLEVLAKTQFPHHQIISIDTYDTFMRGGIADLLLIEEPEAISLTLLFPPFAIIYPSPSLGTSNLAYPLPSQSERFLNFVNQWLELKKSEGFTQKQYEIWILGKTETAAPNGHRWSILRDVLHWID